MALLLAFSGGVLPLRRTGQRSFSRSHTDLRSPDWTELRVSWEKGHRIRFGLQLVALALILSRSR
jgi:hypothetical protein